MLYVPTEKDTVLKAQKNKKNEIEHAKSREEVFLIERDLGSKKKRKVKFSLSFFFFLFRSTGRKA